VTPKPRVPLPAQIALAVGTALLVAAGGYFLLVGPQRARASDLGGKIELAEQQLEDHRQATLRAGAIQKIEVADLFRLSKAMPDRADMSGMLLELNRVAADTGITFESISPQTAVPISGYQAVPIQVTFKGNFYNLSDFLYRLRTLVHVDDGRLAATGRLFAIDTLDFAEAQEGFPRIGATLVVDAFVYGTGVPATATPAATTTTTTTVPTVPSVPLGAAAAASASP
jgi:type IV pilus assembly PilO-like protein